MSDIKNARYNFFITLFIPHSHNQMKYSLYLSHRQESNENRAIQGHSIDHSPLDSNKMPILKTLAKKKKPINENSFYFNFFHFLKL